MTQPSSPTLLVMAAGMGSRYGGLKQIDPMGPSGETILDYSVFDAARAGFKRVVFIIRPDFESAFRARVGARFGAAIAVDYVFQTLDRVPPGFSVPEGREKPWGTGHAILCARDAIRENFAVINADDFYGAESYRVLAGHLAATPEDSSDFSMVGFTLKNTLSDHGSVARGVCKTDNNGFLTGIEEMLKIEKTARGARNTLPDGSTVELSGDEPVSMNMWGFTPRLFPHLAELFERFLRESGADTKSECLIPTAIGQLVRDGVATCRVLRTPSSWFGVTYREDKPVAQASIARLVAEGAYPAALW